MYHDGSRLSHQQMALLQYEREIVNFLGDTSIARMLKQVALAHLLAARDQEPRTLSVEASRNANLKEDLVSKKKALEMPRVDLWKRSLRASSYLMCIKGSDHLQL
ncbi:hypothetical protein Tco_0696149 [Tanacetum coccineum]